MKITTQLLNDPSIKLRSEKELAKLDNEKALEFLTVEHRAAYGHKQAHVVHAVNCGRMLTIQKLAMNYGEFRAWTRSAGLDEWQTTYYMRVARAAERFGADPAKMSARAILRLEKKPGLKKDEIRKAREKHDKRSAASQHRDRFTLLADQVEQALHDDKQMFGEVLAPRLKTVLKEYGKTRDRQKAVNGEEEGQ
jgi:hypothetical protein